MSKKKKIVIISCTCAIVLLIGIITAVITMTPVKGEVTSEFWTKNLRYDINDTVQIEKEPGKDFVILNLTDIQFSDTLDIGKREFTKETIDKLINDVKPDLITMTGDQVWTGLNKYSVKDFVKMMDSYKIPWAPVFGNHDREGNADINWIAEQFGKSQYCLMKKGPNNIGGVGNYVVNIMEGDRIYHSLIMMDSGGNRDYSSLKEEDKIISYRLDENFELAKDAEGNYIERTIGTNYEFISDTQIEWYKWNIRGAEEYNKARDGMMPQSSLFIHIPLPEYYLAYVDYLKSGKDESFEFVGAMREDVCCPRVNSGMFDAVMEMGSTKDIVAGHDHVNDYSLVYKGVRLTYGVKTGDRCYWQEGVNGGTVITIGKTVIVEQKYINV